MSQVRALTNIFTSRLLYIKVHTVVKMEQNFSNIIYKSLDSVLEHLNKRQFENLTSVRKLLDIYNTIKNEAISSTDDKKFPLLVLEGLDGCGKSTATKRVSNFLNAEMFCTPPPCIKPIRDDFDSPEYKEVRTAYYALGNYIAALQIAVMLRKNPVVLDRFWHSTAAYAIAQAVADNPDIISIPPQEDPIYHWPEDLLQPDVIAYLCVNEEARLQRLKNRVELTDQEHLLQSQAKFRSDVVQVYNRITPKMNYINAQLSKGKIAEQILQHIRPLLPSQYFG